MGPAQSSTHTPFGGRLDRLEHRYEIRDDGGCLWVSQSGCLPTVAAAKAMQRRIEAEVEAKQCRIVVFDNRQTEASSAEVRDCMFGWALGETFVRVAILVDGAMTAVRANMEALASGGALKAFDDPDAARAWVRRVPAALRPRR